MTFGRVPTAQEQVTSMVEDRQPYEVEKEDLNSVLVLKSIQDIVRGLNRTGRAKMMEAMADYTEGHTILTPENVAVVGTVLRTMAATEAR